MQAHAHTDEHMCAEECTLMHMHACMHAYTFKPTLMSIKGFLESCVSKGIELGEFIIVQNYTKNNHLLCTLHPKAFITLLYA